MKSSPFTSVTIPTTSALSAESACAFWYVEPLNLIASFTDNPCPAWVIVVAVFGTNWTAATPGTHFEVTESYTKEEPSVTPSTDVSCNPANVPETIPGTHLDIVASYIKAEPSLAP